MRYFLILILAVSCFSFGWKHREVITYSGRFNTGERLNYRMNMGIFTVGKGMTTVDVNYYLRNNHSCYKVDAFMETLGMTSLVSKVDDNWGAYIDTSELVTYESYRQLREGRYRLQESIIYDHNNDKAFVQVGKMNSGESINPKVYSTPHKVRDIVAGFMYMRVIDFSKYRIKDTLALSGFFEDKAYNFKILYFGQEKIKTSLGKILCHKLVPIMPDNKLFRGKNSVIAWISADGNQIPIRVEAKMFIGRAGVELVGFKGLRSQLKIIY